MPDPRRHLRRLTTARPVSRAVAHLAVIGLVAFTAAFGLSTSAAEGAPSTGGAAAGSVLSFNFVGPARAADQGGEPLESRTFELVPDPTSDDPVIARRAAPVPPTPEPTPLPTPVAPPPPAPDPTPPPAPKPAVVTGSGALAWPVAGGSITQYYRSGHLALDIAAPSGTTVMSADAGVVTWAGWRSNGGGYVIAVDHGNGMQTVYNHLGSIWVSAGQAVARGQGIGGVGCSGICTGPHLHFEVIVGGVIVNPLRYL